MIKHLFRCSVALVFLTGGAQLMARDSVEERAQALIQRIEDKVKPVNTEASAAWWDAATTGSDAAYARRAELDNQLNLIFADHELYAALKTTKEEIASTQETVNPYVRRQIDKLYLSFLGKQGDVALLKEITDLGAKIEQQFNVYRGEVDGQQLSENELRDILKKSNDNAAVKKAWEASKGVGSVVESDLKTLVKKRNELAQQLGFANFQEMSLVLDEHNPEQLSQLFDELDTLTKDSFAEVKGTIDAALAQQFGISVGDLRPWNYREPFFQAPPDIYGVSLDTLYSSPDQIVNMTKSFYNGIGLSVDHMMTSSDLFPREGKSQHAFCTDIDRAGDTRVLANVIADEDWMSTMLHEFGHSIYSGVYFPDELPYFLKDAAHTLTTEGLAMMFDRQTKVPQWMTSMAIAPEDTQAREAIFNAATNLLRQRLLLFSRWAQVMYRFEKSMYADPDQDLNKLWWDLVEKYQLVTRPEGRNAPDYAAKIHIIVAPVYYHNYALGDLFASQLHHAIARELEQSPQGLSYADQPRVGAFIKAKVIDPGASLDWNGLTEFATGQRLNAAAFAEDMRAAKKH